MEKLSKSKDDVINWFYFKNSDYFEDHNKEIKGKIED